MTRKKRGSVWKKGNKSGVGQYVRVKKSGKRGFRIKAKDRTHSFDSPINARQEGWKKLCK